MKAAICLMWIYIIAMSFVIVDLNDINQQTAPNLLIGLAWFCGGILTTFFTMKDKKQ